MPMGLCNSAPVFERLMETVLSGLTWKICLVYLDDVIIFSKSFEEHMKNLKEVFQRLKAANLKLNPKKCNFLKTEFKFLGHIDSESGVATDTNKIQSVKDWPVPKSIKDVRSFLGLTSYYRKFILKYADKAKPLYKVTEKNQKFVWTEDCQQSFEELKNTLISAPILAYPTREDLFILDTDASNVGMGSSAVSTPRWNRKMRVCTRSKDYGCSQNEKDNPDKEINFENVSESQLSDDVISIIIQWKIDEVKPTWADVSHMSPEVKFYWSRLNSLILVNEILYRKWESYNGKHYDLHIVLPASFKRFVLNQVHNTVTGGRLGVRKTLSKIKQRYFWYKMRQDVKFW
ncbi:Retrovirus-related Pol polyprotein from transposon 297,Retrovirus-related Pol polyprotein from transposon opus,Retrovirus-related Pol polyprotein from transposon 17.6 [Mytilus coruscus]|uniref:Retrovirus-related Pol polyprotein from transposon 297,Retrovirus-related Pol polyprotein from transposon opus,Retrovirus-related Pol polyprotein from transposon 17.6 n=1 Tax=Mytilus coruscus TaxID=42192 RepID=A0A6J8BNS6_MYTCO|nr:Retrovirus-related Pol polyprotein from transposon 297,Retrovirus-related Pol polyprotein from transposon opus,Retrovirus-related Pol polyprotein from transposon 17.6 [Mytilus coruscus]